MGVDFQSPANGLKNTCYESLQKASDDAMAERDQKQAEAKAAMSLYNKLRQVKAKAHSKYKTLLLGNDKSAIKNAKSNYMTACASCTEADWNADIKNSSALDSIFRAGDIANSAILAKASLFS